MRRNEYGHSPPDHRPERFDWPTVIGGAVFIAIVFYMMLVSLGGPTPAVHQVPAGQGSAPAAGISGSGGGTLSPQGSVPTPAAAPNPNCEVAA